ncbi:MAG TPA: DUF2911 domain-containing protein [Thermoanaerobaculia bacterium]|nr:DUF2911 domain-containing protein [Thermoanaerobaculia bacterium]
MKAKTATLLGLGLASLAATSRGQQPAKPLSPRGTASTQVGGSWTAGPSGGAPQYPGGKWIEVDYGRPILRGRKNIFGSGADYGKGVNAGAPVWRAGAGPTTKLSTEVPLVIGGKTLPPGTYDVLVELKESGWTLVLSTQKTQDKYDPNEKIAMWGSFGYDPKFDVVRAPMAVSRLEHSVDQFTISFLDMTDSGGRLGMAWETTAAIVDFSVAR